MAAEFLRRVQILEQAAVVKVEGNAALGATQKIGVHLAQCPFGEEPPLGALYGAVGVLLEAQDATGSVAATRHCLVLLVRQHSSR